MSSLDLHPVFNDFACAVKDRVNDLGEGFWDCMPDFERLVSRADSAVADILTSMIENVSIQPSYESPYWDIDQMIFYDIDRSINLSLVTLYSRPQYLFNAVTPVCYGVIGTTEFRYRRYQLRADCDRSVFDPAERLAFVEEAVVKPGRLVTMLPGVDVLDWDTSTPIVMLRILTTSTVESLQWAFDRATLAPWMASSADPNATQLICLADYLGLEGSYSSVDALRELSRHEQHHVRWSAIRNIARIDREEGLISIRNATNDSHPHIRNAAEKTLARLG